MAGKPPPRRTVMQLVKNVSSIDPPTRWSDMQEAREHPHFKSKNSALIDAKFEIIFQEAYFNYRIRTLLVAFFSSGKVKEGDRKAIFASIEKVLRVSDIFLSDLEQCWQRDIFLSNVFDVIRKHEGNFDVYAKHTATLKATLQYLKKLKTEKKEFAAVIDQWKVCPDNIYHLDLETFLSLPQDRIMSLIMSVESSALLVARNDAEYKSSQGALKVMRKVSARGNFPAMKPESRSATPTKAPMSIFSQITFAEEVAKFTVEIPGRQVILIEEVTLIRNSGTPVTKWSSRHLILFNDILLITRRRDDRFLVEDHCQLGQLEVKSTEDFLALMPDPSLTDIQHKLLLIKLKENHEKKTVLMLFSCAHEANRVSWQNILQQPLLPLPEQQPVTALDPEPMEIPDVDNAEQLTHNRTSQDMRIIEELKRKQQARKRNTEWTAHDEPMQYNSDGLYRPGSMVTAEEVAGFASNDGQWSGDPLGDAARERGDDLGSNGMERITYQIPRPTSSVQHVGETSTTPTTPKKLVHKPSTRDPTRQPGLHPADNQSRKESGVEATITFDRMLEYPPGMMVFPLVSSVRWIVKQGTIIQRWQLEDRKFVENKIPMTLTLFNDVVFFTVPKKSEPRLKVISYGMRNLVDITPVRHVQYLPSKYLTDTNDRFMFMVHLLENHKRKEEIMVVSVGSENEREAWLKALPPPSLDESGDRVFDAWDCPQVIVTQPHKPAGPNQLHLSVNDKLLVRRRRADGWCEGERVSDGEAGLFPGHCTNELDSPHKYAKSVRRRLQIIAEGNR